MKHASKLIAAALAAGIIGLVASAPAMAQDKESHTRTVRGGGGGSRAPVGAGLGSRRTRRCRIRGPCGALATIVHWSMCCS